MNVKKLIEALQAMPPDLPVYIWADGDRYPIVNIDDSWIEEGGWIDIHTMILENFNGY